MTVGSQVKTSFATIKSMEASLMGLANKTTSTEAKKAFEQASELIAEVKKDLEKQVIMLSQEEPQYKQ